MSLSQAAVSFGRAAVVTLSIALCVALLVATIPAAASAAPQGKAREYIVTLKVKDSGRSIKPTSRANKVRIRQRAKAARAETSEVTQRQGVRARHRYGNVITGFSARMTRAEARKVARDPAVASVRVARTFKVAASAEVPVGVERVKAYPRSSGRDVAAHVAIIDTGIGPALSNGEPVSMTTDELNIAGGYNCAGTPPTQQADEPASEFADRLAEYRGRYGDVNGHGTHVAGTVGARDNGIGAVGVAPGASLWAVRVFGSSGFTSEAAIVCGLDWVLETHVSATPDIHVVNMSIQGPRSDLLENCGQIIGNSDADPMQEAICKLKDIGVPVVASAGNDGINANDSAPGGYDQVISVAAMTDTDGAGWEKGGNATCLGYKSERDDTFASYSNHGPDVDIVAPGTCVRSTALRNANGSLNRDGDRLVALSGTSMAAPHVTGAIARYVDAVGRPSSVGQMRQLIRAAGRSDWDPKTDPVWFGVNDDDPPNRVLDVAALTGGPAVKTFLYHQSFTVAGAQTSRSTRVDVQRGGGYDGPVTLSVSGLPGAAGSTSFVGGDTLSGLSKHSLGTKLDFSLDPAGPEDVFGVAVRSNGAGVAAHERGLQLTIDRTAPTVAGLGPKVRGQKTGISRKGATQVFLRWNANDALTGVASAQLQRKTGSAAWKDAGVGGASSSRVFLKPGQVNRFRVRVSDQAGNTKTSYTIGARLSVRDSKSSLFTKAGSWKTRQAKKAFGGSLLIATAGKATLTASFTGKATALVAPVGNGRGKFRVRVDGGPWKSVNTKSKRAGQRKVVWTERLSYGKHTVEVQRVSGKPALDGLLIVR
ncbi:MAG: S8 family serine peptidase [Candidatus Limnocylindrales bacterium]